MTVANPIVATVESVLPARPDIVYGEWLDPEALRDWMCPRPARATNVEVDPRVGGELRIDIVEDGVEFYVAGRFLELDRPHRLAFTWTCSTWPEPQVDSIVTVTFTPHGDAGTHMAIRHSALPSQFTPGHQRGWERIAEQLAQKLRA